MSHRENRNPLTRARRDESVRSGERVTCHSCLCEVPRSVATTAEGSDYVFYFCGPECFARWRVTYEPDSASPA